MFWYNPMPWWMETFEAWSRVKGLMTLDEIWRDRDREQDARNAERAMAYATRKKIAAAA